MRYQIDVTEEQAELIQNALDLYGRVIAGQPDEISFVIGSNRSDLKSADMTEIRNLCRLMKKYISTNFSGLPDKCDDMLQVIRFRLAWDREPYGGSGIRFHKPLLRSGMEPIKISASNHEQE